MRVCLSDELAEMFHACRKAAKQGDAAAHYAFGLKFYYGEEVPQKDIQAHLWWNLPENAGSSWDQELKDKAYELRWCLEQEMTPAQIAAALRLASEWMKKH
jgi:TPR repeat protein